MATSFVKRRIEVAIKLAPNTQTNQPSTFADSGRDTVTLKGMRMSAQVQNAGGAAGNEASVSIWGLSPSLINQLSTLGMIIQGLTGNTATITAGDEGATALATVFVGTITDAYADFSGAPNVPFHIKCRAGASQQAVPFPVSSYTGQADVATVLSTIANQLRWGFENHGVSVQLANPYFSGSAMEQIEKIVAHARIRHTIAPGSTVGKPNTLVIWPRYGNVPSPGGIPLISKATGMKLYPTYIPGLIKIETLFDPRITFGAQVKVESELFTTSTLQRLRNAQSVWNVSRLDLTLDAELPGGQWLSVIQAYNPGVAQPPPVPAGG